MTLLPSYFSHIKEEKKKYEYVFYTMQVSGVQSNTGPQWFLLYENILLCSTQIFPFFTCTILLGFDQLTWDSGNVTHSSFHFHNTAAAFGWSGWGLSWQRLSYTSMMSCSNDVRMNWSLVWRHSASLWFWLRITIKGTDPQMLPSFDVFLIGFHKGRMVIV